MSPDSPPLVVLCSHRSGSSAFMGLLAHAGLELGDQLPPAPDNPKGFFETRAIVEFNRKILFDRDRDWTCPPPTIDHRTIDLDPLRTIAADFRDTERPWGFKDPRSLFTLPAIAAGIGDCRLVGVHRNSTDIARSIADRNGFSPEDARNIALAYADRLAEAHRRLRFPIVSFDAPREEFVARTKQVAVSLGLEWDDERAQEFFEVGLVHHRSSDQDLDDVDAYLAEAARAPIEQIRSFTPATIVRTWDSLPTDAADALATTLGPRESMRRNELFASSRRLLPSFGEVAVIGDHAGTIRLPETTAENLSLDDLAAPSEGDRRWSHVIAPSALDHVDPDELPELLEEFERRLEPAGVLALGGWVLAGPDLPSHHTFQPSGVTAHRDRTPYVHHLDRIASALLPTGLWIADVVPTPGGRTHVYVSNNPALANPKYTGSLTRQNLEEQEELAQAHLEELERTRRQHETTASRLETERTERKRFEAELARTTASLAAAEHRIDQLDEELTATQLNLTGELGQASARLEAAHKQLADAMASRDSVRQQLDRSEARLEDVRKSVGELKARVRKAEKAAAASQRKYERLSNRRIVRLALTLARPMGPIFRLVRRLRSGPKPESEPTVTPAAEPRRARVANRAQVVDAVRRLRPDRYADSGPLVSIVILTRDGAHHLRRLFPALDTTTYRSFEVIVVDNGSTDDTAAVLGEDWSFPLRVVRNEGNRSFSDANNQGVDAAQGDLFLFLNNDLEPITDQWLGAMVAAAQRDPEVAAVGALLVYPDRGEPSTDFTVQHRGIGFTLRDGAPHAVNLAADDAADPSLVGVLPVPAATAAALLVPRETFEEAGRFTSGYVYGAEDVDLCIKLRQLGSIVVQGDAALFHYESATQVAMEPAIVRVNRMGNWQRYAETWGPTITRSLLRDRLTGAGEWTGRPGRAVAITVTHNDPSKGYGDYYTAHELGDALAAEGWSVHYAQRYGDEWLDLPEDVDMVIALLDAFDVSTVRPGVLRVAWVRNWVDRWMDQPWFDSYDLVVASSERAADAIRRASRFDPPVVPLATNPARFHPGPANATFEAEYTFTGSNWGRGRQLIPLLDIRPGERFSLFGANWDSDPRVGRYWRGLLDYDLIPDLYRSVPIVLDDTAEHTIEHGFVNSRVFDALASGALVLTNNPIGSEELFDGLLPVYHDRTELRRLLDHYLTNEEERLDLVTRLREIVLDRHTYSRRAKRFTELALESVDRPRVAVKIGAPRAESAHEWGDFHFANSLIHALSMRGFSGEVHLLPEWDAPERQDADVVIHLRGLTTYAPKPSQVNIMWLLSHPDDVAPEECDKYDLVCVASADFAKELAEHVRAPVVFLPQATDAVRFGAAEPDEELHTEVLFVGNSRNQRRDAVDWAVDLGAPLTVYGNGWSGIIPDGFVRDTYFPNEDLGRLYASADVVLNDHWPDMRERGFVSNRILDALAAGAFVLSDSVAGLEDLVGDAVPTFSSQTDLAALLEKYLGDADAQRELAGRGRDTVLRNHTFDHRAERLAELIDPLLRSRFKDCDGGKFERTGLNAV